MSQALRPLCLIQFWNWKNFFFSLLALWDTRIIANNGQVKMSLVLAGHYIFPQD